MMLGQVMPPPPTTACDVVCERQSGCKTSCVCGEDEEVKAVLHAQCEASDLRRRVMVSIPRSNAREVGQHGRPNSRPVSGSPSSPSWDETLQQLSRDLQVICRSPTELKGHRSLSRTSSTCSPIPASPTTLTHMASPWNFSPKTVSPVSPISPGVVSPVSPGTEGKLLSVRHLMSEDKLREKLQNICRSKNSQKDLPPTNKVIIKPKRRKQSYIIPYFRATIDVGNRGVEDLAVKVEDNKLRVYFQSEPSNQSNSESNTDLPAEVTLPPEVDPAKLICIVKDGILEVRETRQPRGAQQQRFTQGRLLSGLDLRRTLSGGNSADQSPIVIEDEGSHQFKLVLQIPEGYTFEDLKIKTVDDHLIVSGRKPNTPPKNTKYHSNASPLEAKLQSLGQNHEIFHVFQMPSTADPFSVTAHLTEKHQLVIQAILSARLRSYTM